VFVERAAIDPNAGTNPTPGLENPWWNLDKRSLRERSKILFTFDCVSPGLATGANYYVEDVNSKDQQIKSFRLLFFDSEDA
jgi:hypothetical protein